MIDKQNCVVSVHDHNHIGGILYQGAPLFLGFPQRLFRALALADVAPYGLDELSATEPYSAAAYLDVPYLAALCSMFCLKDIAPFPDDLFDVLGNFLGRFDDLNLGYLELLEFVAGIAEALVGAGCSRGYSLGIATAGTKSLCCIVARLIRRCICEYVY